MVGNTEELVNLFEMILEEIYLELRKIHYGIPNEALKRIEEWKNLCMLKVLKDLEEKAEISLPFYTMNKGDYRKNICIRKCPQIAMPTPIYISGAKRVEFLRPYVVLVQGDRYNYRMESIIVHELCHLFAMKISEYEFYMGLNRYKIEIDEAGQKAEIKEVYFNYDRNEMVNDYVAYILSQQVFPQITYILQPDADRLKEHMEKSFSNLQEANEKLIAAYFDHNNEFIDNLIDIIL